MRQFLLSRNLCVVSLASTLLFTGCAGTRNGTSTVPAPSRPTEARIDIKLPAHRGVDSGKRYTDSNGTAVAGLKLRGSKRNYWFPEETRITRYDSHLLVVAYRALFVYPRKTIKLVDNAHESERDLEAVPVEKNPALIAFMQTSHGTRHGSTAGRLTSNLVDPYSTDGWRDVWDPSCICPDCSWDPTGGWSEQGPCGIICQGSGSGGYYTLNGDPAYDCAVTGYADDPDLYASCLAAGGPNGPAEYFIASYDKMRATMSGTPATPIR